MRLNQGLIHRTKGDSTSHQPRTLTVIGASWCPDYRRTKVFLSDQRITYDWIDLDTDPAATAIVEELHGGSRLIPTVIFPDDTHLAEPGNDELADKLGLSGGASESKYDLIIVGGGPTGVTAATFAAREKDSVLVIDKVFHCRSRWTPTGPMVPGQHSAC